MTALLNHPTTKQPCAFVASLRGHIALRCDYVTPQVRWFKQSAVEAANPGVNVLAAFDSGLDYCYPQPLLTVVLTPEMAAHVNASALVNIVVKKPAPFISLYAEALRAA